MDPVRTRGCWTAGDRDDIAALVEHLELKEPKDAIRIYKDLFPNETVKFAARQLLDWAFLSRTLEHDR